MPLLAQQGVSLFAHFVDFVVLLIDQRRYLPGFLPLDAQITEIRDDPADKTGNRQNDH